MEEELFKIFREKMCCFCSIKNTLHLKHIYCLDYKTNKKNLSKKQIRENRMLDNDKMKYIVSLTK